MDSSGYNGLSPSGQRHVVSQNGKDRLDLYQVDVLKSDTKEDADQAGGDAGVALRFIKSHQVFGGVHLLEKLRIDSREVVFLMTSDMTLRLLTGGQDRVPGISTGDDLVVISQLPMDQNVDQALFTFFRQEQAVVHFAFDQKTLTAIICFAQSDLVLMVYFKRSATSILEIVDFELDSIEQLGDSVDIISGGDNMKDDFALYFVINKPIKTLDVHEFDPLFEQIKKDKKRKNEKIITENTTKKLKAQ